jgi:hypothetical protein
MSADPRQPTLFEDERREPRQPSRAVTVATATARRDSYAEIRPTVSRRLRLILRALATHGPQTAREILRRLIAQGDLPPASERNAVSPRLTAAAKTGLVDTLPDLRTVPGDAPASVWVITERGRLLLDTTEGNR